VLHTVEVDDGTVYKSELVFADGLLCPKTLYVIAMLFPYAPISKNGLSASCADPPPPLIDTVTAFPTALAVTPDPVKLKLETALVITLPSSDTDTFGDPVKS
jgi:hypothetical protein